MKEKCRNYFTASQNAAGAAETAIDYSTGTPWMCAVLDGLVTQETETPDLKDDFYLACNKDGIAALKIPEGYSSMGTQMETALQTEEDIKNLFTSGKQAESHDAQLALNLYSLYMDWEGRNARGIAPLKKETEAAEQIDTLEALTAYLVKKPVEEQLYSFFETESSGSLEDSTVHILMAGPSALLLDDAAEYSNLTAYGAVRKEAYRTLSVRMLCKLGYSEKEAAQKFDNCLAFETALAPSVMTREETRRPDYIARINNHYTRNGLLEAQGRIPVIACLEENMGFPQTDDYLLTQPAWMDRLNGLYTEENLPLLRDYLIVHGVISAAGRLDRECYEWNVDCRNTITGAAGMLPDEIVFSTAVAGALPWPVSQLYTETYLTQKDKDRITGLIDRILEEYHGIIREADFLSEGTKAAAIEKLETLDKRVLWPDSWKKYSCEKLAFSSAADGGELYEALKAIARFNIDKSCREFPDPVDKEIWAMAPTVFNCFYDPTVNCVNILGAFARGNIYRSDMSDEDLYARLGMVIGHEISHAFDSTGAQFDKEGNMALWWTQEDWDAFNKKNKKMEAYYNGMHPWEGQDFYGSIMTGEGCADMGGLKCMLRLAAQKEGFDYDKFFRSYAELWESIYTLNAVHLHIKDEHPLAYLRVNCVLQQYDEFLDCYGIKEGDGMYLAPEDRVNIW